MASSCSLPAAPSSPSKRLRRWIRRPRPPPRRQPPPRQPPPRQPPPRQPPPRQPCRLRRARPPHGCRRRKRPPHGCRRRKRRLRRLQRRAVRTTPTAARREQRVRRRCSGANRATGRRWTATATASPASREGTSSWDVGSSAIDVGPERHRANLGAGPPLAKRKGRAVAPTPNRHNVLAGFGGQSATRAPMTRNRGGLAVWTPDHPRPPTSDLWGSGWRCGSCGGLDTHTAMAWDRRDPASIVTRPTPGGYSSNDSHYTGKSLRKLHTPGARPSSSASWCSAATTMHVFGSSPGGCS